MAENSLLEHPFFSPQPAAPVDDLSSRLSAVREPLPPEPTRGDIARDVGRSIVSEGGKALTAVLMGGPIGSAERMIFKDMPEAVRGAGLYAAERMDLISPQERQERSGAPLPWLKNQSTEQASGQAAPFTHNPTYKGLVETMGPVARAAGAPALDYKSQTPAGKIAGSAAEAAAQGIIGPGTLASRMLTGAAAGGAGEFAALSAEPESETTARIAGALTGGVGTGAAMGIAGKILGAVRGAVAPGGAAERELAGALAQDIRRGHSTMTLQQINDAIARGAPVAIADMAGPETRKILARYAEKTPTASEAATGYNKMLADRASSAGSRLSKNFEDIVGVPINAPALQQAVERAGATERDTVYNIVRSTPQAQAINQAPFSHLFSRPFVQDAMRRAGTTAKNDPSLNIIEPTTVAAVPATPSVWKQTPQGFRQIPGTPAVPAQVTPGNLSYWDQVQRELREMGEKAIREPGGRIDAASIRKAREELLSALDKVPGYTAARGRAFETFQAANAPDAGYKFFSNMNAFKRNEVSNAVRQMTPEQRDLFSVGFMHAVDEAAKSGNISNLAKKFGTDQVFRERAELALGPQRFAAVQGSVLSEDIISKAKQLAFIRTEGGLAKSALEGGIAGAALDAAITGAQISPDIMYKAAMGAAAAAIGRLAMDAAERKIADKILPLAVSQDPKDIQKLGELARQSKAVGTLLGKISASMSAAMTQGDRVERKSGGRVSHEHLVNRLMKACASAKKDEDGSTKALLDAPDEHIVKALDVAQRAL